MIAELISVGTEILLGNIVNTNSAYLSEKCAQVGLSVYYQTVVGDNEERMKMTIKSALERSDVIILLILDLGGMFDILEQIFVWVSVALTIISLLTYIMQNKNVLSMQE